MIIKKKVLAIVLGMVLSSGAFACPTEQFQRQDGNFKWMVSGSFNGGTPFTYSGSGLWDLRALFVKHFGDKLGDPGNMFVPTGYSGDT